MAAVVFVATAQSPDDWPKCQIHDKALRSGKPIFDDVRNFIWHAEGDRHRSVTFSSNGLVGMVLQDAPHEFGEVVKDVQADSQAMSAGVRKGWIITSVDGRKFKKGEGLKDVVKDFDKAKKAGVTLQVKFDVHTYIDCTNGDCSHSDKFPCESAESCADACGQVAAREWWSFGDQDGDPMCWLQGQSGSSLTTWDGMTTAPKSCSPKPAVSAPEVVKAWPECIVENSHIYGEGGPVFADMRPFIKHADDVRHRVITFKSEGDVGMVLRDKPHEFGEIVSEVQDGSQAFAAGVRKGWIIKELDGKPFKKGEALDGVGHDFTEAKSEAPTIIVKFDVRTAMDCNNADCANSDKFPALTQELCAEACSSLEACKWWTYGPENEDMMCWFRKSDTGVKAQVGATSGKNTCAPPRRWKYILFFCVVLAALGVFYRQQLAVHLHKFPVLQRLFASTTTQLSNLTARAGVPGMELGKVQDGADFDDFDLDDDERNENASLIGRGRRR